MKRNKNWLALILALLLVYLFLPDTVAGKPAAAPTPTAAVTVRPTAAPKQSAKPTPAVTPKPTKAPTQAPAPTDAVLDEGGSYTTKEDLALYIHTYGHLPPNFVTKKEAEAAGWKGGSLERVLPGMCIGGGRFGNLEGQLPKAKGRVWTECDVNTLGKKFRGAERIIFSNDGLIYYTGDHYETFELLYD